MNYPSTLATLAALMLLATDLGASTAPADSDVVKKAAKEKSRKTPAKIQLVDINSASPTELKKLPGIGDAEALKIVAGRPYGSKAWLMTKQILPEGVYMSIKDRIIARQPFLDGDKNAELYKKK